MTPAHDLNTYINDQFKNPVVHEANMSLSQPELDLYSDIVSLPTNQISSLAYQVYMSLSNPTTSGLIPLGKIYINQVGHIIEAAKWFDHPYSLTTCDIDIDYDGNSECILANNSLFLTIEPQGAYIPFIFSRDENGAHQIVGPSWELLIGIGDPSVWNLTRGVMSDPGQILGAFADLNFDNNRYNAQIQDGMITFENELSLISKTVFIDQ